jgi:hypothetical protein
MSDDLRAAFDELAPGVHPSLGDAIQRSLVAGRRPRRAERRWIAPLGAAVLALLLLAIGARFIPAARTTVAIPAQPPQAITRTSAAAQVAWLEVGASLVGYDPAGKRVATIPAVYPNAVDLYNVWRSPDGAEIFTAGPDNITAHDAATGTTIASYRRPPGSIAGDAFSPDGHYLALLVNGAADFRLQVIDLQAPGAQPPPFFSIPHDQGAVTPGLSGGGQWGTAVFGPDSTRLYTITDWGGPTRLTAFELSQGRPVQVASSVDGQAGKQLPSCDGPALVSKVVGDGGTMVGFCHSSGLVRFIDLRTLNLVASVNPQQGNPFWYSPIFTPDGKRLYLHQWPGFSDKMTMIDLVTRKLYGPAPTPQKTGLPGIFAGLFTDAYAGGVASTVPLSPDGLKLYSATPDGIMVLRVPDLQPLAKLAPGSSFSEVWVSGDGSLLYAITEDGRTVTVMHSDGSQSHLIHLPGQGTFIASEHG